MQSRRVTLAAAVFSSIAADIGAGHYPHDVCQRNTLFTPESRRCSIIGFMSTSHYSYHYTLRTGAHAASAATAAAHTRATLTPLAEQGAALFFFPLSEGFAEAEADCSAGALDPAGAPAAPPVAASEVAAADPVGLADPAVEEAATGAPELLMAWLECDPEWVCELCGVWLFEPWWLTAEDAAPELAVFDS